MRALIEEKPEFQSVRVFKLEWSDFRDDPITKQFDVRHRATLVMLKEGKEVGRVLWSNSKAKIEPLIQAAL